MSFSKMQEALRAEGWFVEWNMPCCQSCAWAEVEHDDLSKVLFNHSQDCEIDSDGEDCSSCDGDGQVLEGEFGDENQEYVECDYCGGEGILYGSFDTNELGFEPDTSVDGFSCMPPEVAGGSTFCFDGSAEGVANFKAVIPLIESSGCKVNWNGSGDTRPYISWGVS